MYIRDDACDQLLPFDALVPTAPPLLINNFKVSYIIRQTSRHVGIVIRTGPEIEPARLSVQWFTGPTVKNQLNRWFDSFGPDELNRPQIF